MIYDKLSNIQRYKSINKNLAIAIDWLTKTDISKLSFGKHLILNDDIFAFNNEASVGKEKHQSVYEYHKKYADLHVVLDNRETFYFEHADALKEITLPFSEKDDVTLTKITSERNHLKPIIGEFLIFFPNEGHVPQFVEKSNTMRKLVIKVRMGE